MHFALSSLLAAQDSTTVGWFREIVELLQTGGPWTLLVVAGWVIWKLYEKREADKVKHDAEKQHLNDRLLAMAERQNEVLEKATRNQALLLEAVREAQGAPRLLVKPLQEG